VRAEQFGGEHEGLWRRVCAEEGDPPPLPQRQVESAQAERGARRVGRRAMQAVQSRTPAAGQVEPAAAQELAAEVSLPANLRPKGLMRLADPLLGLLFRRWEAMQRLGCVVSSAVERGVSQTPPAGPPTDQPASAPAYTCHASADFAVRLRTM
jgi:hypothetical protein